jgi:hypothetical protein
MKEHTCTSINMNTKITDPNLTTPQLSSKNYGLHEVTTLAMPCTQDTSVKDTE